MIYVVLFDGIKILDIPFGFRVVVFSSLQEALDEDVWQVDMFLKLKDVQVAFSIFSQCFA
jgi:hypothetical protein